jgi:hypothetical protein
MQIPVQRYVPGPNSPEEMLTDDERCCLRRLIGHLNDHRGHYWRAIWLTETATDRAVRLEDWTLDGNPVEDVIDNVLLDFVGEWAVLPVAAGAEEALAPIFDLESLATPQLPYNEYVEQMLTLPARGVFAEAKLGHCNASEIIDYDRFWDWQSSPIPDDAPAIEPASTESRYQDPTKGLAATPFPAAMVNIVNPQALPDPTGLNAAAGVLSSLGAFRDMSGLKELGPYLQTLSNNATQLASQGMKNAQMPALINAIRGAKELPEPERARLIGELLGGQVKPIALPAPAPAATPKKPAGTGSPPPEPTQATKPPAPEPAPAPKPIPAPKPQRSPSLSDKTRLLVFTFAFETGDVMMGRWTVELLSGGDSRRESRAINTVGAVSGVDIGNRIEMYIEDSFGGDSDVSVHIHGAIVGLPQVLSVGTRTYEMKTWSEARDFTNDIPRTTFNKTRTVRVVQGTEPVDYKIQRSITDTTAETKVSQTSAGLEVGVENAVEVGGSVPGIAEGKEAVKVHAKGTLGWMGSTTGLVQGTNGWARRSLSKATE